MSAANWFLTEKRAFEMRTVNLTTSSTIVTYTAKVGRTADDLIFDRFIRVTSSTGNNMAITVPDGVFYGQELYVLFEVEGNAETVDVTTTTGDDATQMTAAGGYWIGMWHGATIGWATIAGSAT